MLRGVFVQKGVQRGRGVYSYATRLYLTNLAFTLIKCLAYITNKSSHLKGGKPKNVKNVADPDPSKSDFHRAPKKEFRSIQKNCIH